MKHFFEQYGGVALGILALLVLIAMITPVGNIIKTSLQGTVEKFSSGISNQTNTGLDATLQMQIKAGMEPNPYTEKVMSVQQLYDVGENNLTEEDIIKINGINCYVLKVEDNKAKLITVDIYNAPFDSGGHNSGDVENYVGTGRFSDKTYDYKYSTLKKWMDNFYKNELKSDSRILKSDVEYQINSSYPHSSLLSKYYIEQYVFPLEYTEARNNSNKLIWNSGSKLKNYFWILYGYKYNNGTEYAVAAAHIGYNNNGNSADVHLSGDIGARPVFWISLE